MTEKVTLKDDFIIVNNITIDDANTYKILEGISEDKREDFIKKAIVIGTIGLRNLSMAENVDYVEKEFNELLKNLDDQSKGIREEIKSTLDIENNSSSLGKMRVLFEDYFDKKGGKISNLLSPFDEESPIRKLKDEIFQKIQELRDEVIKDKSKEEIIEKTTLKGGDFEEAALEAIEDYCSEYEDVVAPVGETSGKLNKIGDITIDIDGDENKRIIVECKDSSHYSHKKTIDEINDAIENRSAKFGIFLFKSQPQIPSALTPMKITNNYIITSYDSFGLYCAVRVARLFVLRSTQKKQQEIPIGEIQKEIESLNGKLLDFKNIHSKLTQIDNASDYIRRNIERLKKDIEEGLGSIKELLNNH